MIQRLTVSKALTAPPFQYARANGFARQRITHPHRPFVVRTSTEPCSDKVEISISISVGCLGKIFPTVSHRALMACR
jgi:hypothetical protein